jgi:hypothetical protein
MNFTQETRPSSSDDIRNELLVLNGNTLTGVPLPKRTRGASQKAYKDMEKFFKRIKRQAPQVGITIETSSVYAALLLMRAIEEGDVSIGTRCADFLMHKKKDLALLHIDDDLNVTFHNAENGMSLLSELEGLDLDQTIELKGNHLVSTVPTGEAQSGDDLDNTMTIIDEGREFCMKFRSPSEVHRNDMMADVTASLNLAREQGTITYTNEVAAAVKLRFALASNDEGEAAAMADYLLQSPDGISGVEYHGSLHEGFEVRFLDDCNS